MKGKLSKSDIQYRLHNEEGIVIATSYDGKLSKQNCDSIFGVVDVEKLANEELLKAEKHHKLLSPITYKDGVKKGFQKAMELNKDKLFTVEDMRTAMLNAIEMTDFQKEQFRKDNDYHIALDIIQSLQQPTEIDVTFNPDEKDSEGCLILKKI